MHWRKIYQYHSYREKGTVFHADSLLNINKTGKASFPVRRQETPDTFDHSEGLVSELSAVFAEELSIPLEKLNPNTNFQEYGVDSILLVSIIHRIEAMIQKKLTLLCFLNTTRFMVLRNISVRRRRR